MAVADDDSRVDARTHTLTYLVGQTRAHVQQLESVERELRELDDPDDLDVIVAVQYGLAAARAIDSIGTERLRASQG